VVDNIDPRAFVPASNRSTDGVGARGRAGQARAASEQPPKDAGGGSVGTGAMPNLAAQKDLQWIYDGCVALGVERERFDRYAEKRWGRGWAVAAAGRKRAIDEVNAFADDPEGFRIKVHAEVEVFT
jgi:hypothetical protein